MPGQATLTLANERRTRAALERARSALAGAATKGDVVAAYGSTQTALRGLLTKHGGELLSKYDSLPRKAKERKWRGMASDETRWDICEAVYEVWEEIGDLDETPTDFEAAQISKALREDYGLPVKETPPRRVVEYLTKRKSFSPHVDDIAVERALNFEWDVIENLTARERIVFIDTLETMADPWGGVDQTGDAEEVQSRSERRVNWMAAPENKRSALEQAVNRLRKRKNKLAAEQAA